MLFRSNPHTNLCGCYEVSIKQIANETGYNNDSVERLLKRLDSAHNVIRYSAQTKELLILNGVDTTGRRPKSSTSRC